MVYDIEGDTWATLPPYACVYFSMANLNKRLLLMGGKDNKTGKRTSILGVWDEKLQRWCYPYPSMPTARSGAAAVTQGDRWLIIAGGTCKSKLKFLKSLPSIGVGVHHSQYLYIMYPQQLWETLGTFLEGTVQSQVNKWYVQI